ncbi:MAG TPA: RraA family protein [Planctomycetes bacterium]|nr:RraA family protein [Planctomycetaceae bacterium]HIM29945.1 RraA family protein [Planctomycetota bacterium]
MTASDVPTFSEICESLYTAVICDALDALGYRHQAPRRTFSAVGPQVTIVGRCKTTLWVDMFHSDPDPYALELKAVDSCQAGDVFIAAAGGSQRSAVWGELLSTSVQARGCVGVIVDGAVRDTAKIAAMNFPCLATDVNPYDSKDRQRVVDMDVAVEIAGTTFRPGELVVADSDGIVVIPRDVEEQALANAWQKVHAENEVRDAIRGGMLAQDAFEKYGVL